MFYGKTNSIKADLHVESKSWLFSVSRNWFGILLAVVVSRIEFYGELNYTWGYFIETFVSNDL